MIQTNSSIMLRRRSTISSIIVIIGLGLATAAIAQTYVTPPSTPFSSGGPVAPALNSSLNSQRKTGSLGVGTAANPKEFCLNLNAPDVVDTTNCIQSWNDLSGQFGGPYVSLSQNVWQFTDASLTCGASVPRSLCPTDYALQQGFIGAQAQSSPQQTFSVVAETPSISLCNQVLHKCTSGAAGYFLRACTVNSDCGLNATAVYGTNASNPAATAGYFMGVVQVLHPTGSAVKGRICLNGQAEKPYNDPVGGVCISSWSEITSAATPLYVKRQTTNPPVDRQNQGGAISGVLNAGSIIVGDSPAVTTFSCGDGFCSATETVSCPLDCYTIQTPQLSLAMVQGKVDMSVTTKPQQPNPPINVGVLIVRTAATMTFVPVNGVTYTAGQIIGTATVVYVGDVPQNTTVVPQDTLSGPGVYTYRAFQANSYPRYSAPVDKLLGTVRQLTVTISPGGKGFLGSDDGQINCGRSTDPGCKGLYLDQTPVVVTLDATIPPYTYATWSGCDSSSVDDCHVIMNANRTPGATLH